MVEIERIKSSRKSFRQFMRASLPRMGQNRLRTGVPKRAARLGWWMRVVDLLHSRLSISENNRPLPQAVTDFDHLRRAPGPSVVDRSTTERISPTRLNEFAVLDDAWDGRIVARKLEHLGAPRAIVLRVIVDERDAL